MNTKLSFAQGADSLSIGELAERTGVSVATLRMWETRHGFPAAGRTAKGHRRYAPDQVARVLDVQRRRELGVRLDVAITQATGDLVVSKSPTSVYADLVRHHGDQPRQRLRVRTLLALSWAIEDEIAASGSRGHLFGAFQTASSFAAARLRWEELARVAQSTYAFADFTADAAGPGPSERIVAVQLAPDTPMRREWSVVHDDPHLSVALAAWELPGQAGIPDRERLFESVWTLDPAAVRHAARSCALVAAAAGHEDAAELAAGPLAMAASAPPDQLSLTRLAHRVVAYAESTSSGR